MQWPFLRSTVEGRLTELAHKLVNRVEVTDGNHGPQHHSASDIKQRHHGSDCAHGWHGHCGVLEHGVDEGTKSQEESSQE